MWMSTCRKPCRLHDPKDVTLAMVREAWCRKAMGCYSCIVYRMKKIEINKKEIPPFVLEHQWKYRLEHWNHPDMIVMSQKAPFSHKSNPCLHNGGSISMEETEEKMAKDKNSAMTPFEIFKQIHIKNSNEKTADDPRTVVLKWVDSAAKDFQAVGIPP